VQQHACAQLQLVWRHIQEPEATVVAAQPHRVSAVLWQHNRAAVWAALGRVVHLAGGTTPPPNWSCRCCCCCWAAWHCLGAAAKQLRVLAPPLLSCLLVAGDALQRLLVCRPKPLQQLLPVHLSLALPALGCHPPTPGGG
jgi:hypothetical protein